MRTLVAILAALWCSLAHAAPATVTITGKVVAPNGVGIARGSITAKLSTPGSVLAFVACTCPPWFDVAAPGVRMHGTAAAGADAILSEALSRWPDLRGDVSWVDRGDTPAACGRDVAGCTWRRPECGDFAAYVVRLEPATSSALAHELCVAGGLPDDHSPGSDLFVCRDALNAAAAP